jgi:CheY-like chemotaxis protein
VISDVILPEMDGYELCRQVKKDANLADVPIILLTPLADPKDILQSLECGVRHFITTSYDEEELFSRIERVVSNTRIRQGKEEEIGLEINFGGQKCLVNSEHMQVLDLLLSTYEVAVKKNQVANQATEELRSVNERLENRVKERTAALTAEIAQRERVEEELLFKNTLLEAESETTIDGILAVDERGKTLLFNRRFAEMWDIPREILEAGDDAKVQKSVVNQLCDPQIFLAKVNHLYSHREEKSQDELDLKGGKYFDRYTSPLVDRNGKYCGRIWYFRDITGRKQGELALRRVNRALKVTSDCNQVLIRATEEAALLNDVCRILVAGGGTTLRGSASWSRVPKSWPPRSRLPVAARNWPCLQRGR